MKTIKLQGRKRNSPENETKKRKTKKERGRGSRRGRESEGTQVDQRNGRRS